MADGSVVQFTAKQKLAKTTTIGEDSSISTRFDFRNGKTLLFAVPKELLLRFAAHGVEQKIGDCIAGETDIDDAVASMEDLITRLTAGEWSTKRAPGEFSGQSILMKALVEVSGKTAEQVKGFLSPKTAAEKSALRNDNSLRPVIQRLEAEKAAKSPNKVDTTALLGELDVLDTPVSSKKAA
jgi:hypothetical protein